MVDSLTMFSILVGIVIVGLTMGSFWTIIFIVRRLVTKTRGRDYNLNKMEDK